MDLKWEIHVFISRRFAPQIICTLVFMGEFSFSVKESTVWGISIVNSQFFPSIRIAIDLPFSR